MKKRRQTVGRKAKTSDADIQINKEDKHMSRVHLEINVTEGGQGIEHRLQALNPRNPVRVNGKEIAFGDIVVLQWGDKICLGNTEVLFNRPGL